MIAATVSGVCREVYFREQRTPDDAARLDFVISTRRYVNAKPITTRVNATVWGRLAQRVRSRVTDDCQVVASGELALVSGRLTLKTDAIEVIRALPSPQSVTVTLSNGNNH